MVDRRPHLPHLPHLPQFPNLPHLSNLIRHPFTLERVPWSDPRGESLRHDMDVEISALYAHVFDSSTDEENEAISQALAVRPEEILTSILAFDEGVPVGHAAVRPFGDDALEVKKVFVAADARGKGISKLLMAETEVIAREHGYARIILQTGDLQAEAIALYLRMGYEPIPIYGPYGVLPVSLCFGMTL